MSREPEKTFERGSVEAGESTILAEAIHCLGQAVLVRVPGEENAEKVSFEIVGTAPDWWKLWMGKAESIVERSPFLEDFVSGAADEFWGSSDSGGSLRSGFWEEAIGSSSADRADGTVPRFLEAIATKTASGVALLLIEHADERLKRERAYLQSAHELNLERRRLQKESEKKQILLQCITHDLGNPLAAVLLNLENVARQLEDRPSLQSTIQKAIGQSKRQRDLVRSISEVFAADLSAILAPNAEGSEFPDLVAVAAEVLSACASSASEQSVTLCPFFKSPLPVVGNQLYLFRIIENLVLNGIRHSPKGGTVAIGFLERDGFAVFRVEDEGVGIDPEDINWIFEPFAHGRDGNRGQSGLGLYFCRLTAEMWGGRVEVWNRQEGGACFEVWLPCAGKRASAGTGGVKGEGDQG